MMAKLNWHPPKAESVKVRYSYPVPYAIKVWAGSSRVDGTKAPARRWTDAAINRTNFERSFAKHYDGNIRAAFMKTAEEFGLTLKDVINSPMWKWDRITVRSTGEVAGLVRNIVDSGDLRDSQRMDEI